MTNYENIKIGLLTLISLFLIGLFSIALGQLILLAFYLII